MTEGITIPYLSNHRYLHIQFLTVSSLLIQTFAQLVLHSDVAGLVRGKFHQKQGQIIDGPAIIKRSLASLNTKSSFSSKPHFDS